MTGHSISSTRKSAPALFVCFVLCLGCRSDGSIDNPIAVSLDLKRGPYVQAGSTDSITIVWQTYTATHGAVEFGLDETLGTRVEHGTVGISHLVPLTGLEPSTYYYYRVLDGNRALSKLLRFHTNHSSSDAEFSFLVIGDSGAQTPAMVDVARLVNTSDASLGLHTGDVIYPAGEEELYDPNFFYPYAWFLSANVLYPSIGNHDMLTDDAAPYLNSFVLPRNDFDFSERYYSFDYGNAHFVALDTEQPFGPGSLQYAWLENDLLGASEPWKFVFFHRPPYTAGHLTRNGQRFDLANQSIRRNLVPLFEQHGVDIVFSGHSHSYERTFPLNQNQVVAREQEPDYFSTGGPVYIVTGGGGASLLELDSSPLNAVAIAAHHIVLISVSDGELSGRAITPTGFVIDRFSIMQ